MNFEKVLTFVIHEFEKEKIDFALIGGLALNFRGGNRSTTDLDFMGLLAEHEKVKRLRENLLIPDYIRPKMLLIIQATLRNLVKLIFYSRIANIP